MTARDFEIHFKRLYLPLGMYALRFVRDVAESEDLVQEAFMKAWLYLENGGAIDNVQAFMYRAVRNGCLTWLRQQRETLDENFIPEVGEEEID
ncbi:MAG: RNA polymerase sigma-70 factor, partial [Muribaculaceae bacterium]|nr:RNA polymerase sigma-70 factor [Muribaculaceae bacterium]